MFEIGNRGAVTILRMNHGKVNAMDIEFCRGLQEQLDALAGDDCRAVVLTSASKVFSAGVDLIRLLREEPDYINPFLTALENCFQALFEFPKPIVAAVNGAAVAGGCVMAAACDYRLIAKQAKIGVPELRVGVPFPPIALEIIRFVAAPQTFQAMVNIGATYRNEEAVAAGLADSICEPEEIMESAVEDANQLLTIPADVFRITKNHVRMPALANAVLAEKNFGAEIRQLWNSAEIRSMIQNYADRRL